MARKEPFGVVDSSPVLLPLAQGCARPPGGERAHNFVLAELLGHNDERIGWAAMLIIVALRADE